MDFPTAKMDGTTKVFTIFFTCLCLGLPILLFIELPSKISRIAVVFPAVILLSAVISSYLMIPKLSVDEEKTIGIKNSFVDIKIKKEEIEDICEYNEKKFNVRTFGVGGLFGYFGYFNGNDVWYVTNTNKKIKIMTKKKVYMISPENRDAFLQEFQK